MYSCEAQVGVIIHDIFTIRAQSDITILHFNKVFDKRLLCNLVLYGIMETSWHGDWSSMSNSQPFKCHLRGPTGALYWGNSIPPVHKWLSTSTVTICQSPEQQPNSQISPGSRPHFGQCQLMLWVLNFQVTWAGHLVPGRLTNGLSF